MFNDFGRGAFMGLPVVLADSLPDGFGNTLIMAFVHVFAMMAPWLVFGFLMAGLRKHGAGKGPTAALLVSTPQTGIDSILATYALMGPVFAVAYLITIIAGAILCGVVINLVPNAASASVVSASAGHSLSAVHWASAVFLAAMMAYNLIRPVAHA